MKEENNALIRKFNSVDARVTLVVNALLDVKTTSDGINSNLLQLKSDIDRTIHNHDLDLDNLNGKVQVLFNKVNDLSGVKMYSEVYKINLMLPDRRQAISGVQLSVKINRLLSELAGQHIRIDCAFRLGLFSDRYARRIKIRMQSFADRNLIWIHRKNAVKPIYINEDILQNMRQIHGKL
jgi:hypothetical protein